MKNNCLLSVVAVSTLLMVPAIGYAQDKGAEVRTLTGCLSKAEGAHEYKLTTENGSTWELHSKTPQTFASHWTHCDRDRQSANGRLARGQRKSQR